MKTILCSFFSTTEAWRTDDFATHLAEKLTKQAESDSSLTQLEESGSQSDSETDNQSESDDGDEEEGAKSRVDSNPFALLSDD